ncbi:MAG: hypothetical protein ABS52_11105 [Gemmatimonadetes bacterium SCN 70-22]|nr:MAG: hypothetical protein ABS52_11105 [Gemmatimonadetes bacterium SCN 70-22]
MRLTSLGGPVWYDLASHSSGDDGIPRRGREGADWFVRFIEACEAAAEPWLSRVRRELLAARLLPDTVPSVVVNARAAQLALDLKIRARDLDDAIARTWLLPAERDRARDLLAGLERAQRLVLPEGHLAPSVGSLPARATDGLLLDLSDAYRQLEALGVMSLSSPRALRSRLPTVRVVRVPASSSAGRARIFLDRVDFACYCLGAYAPGTSRLAPWARRGRLVLGALRDAELLIHALSRVDDGVPATGGTLPGVLAALGLLDDTLSRDALVSFLEGAMTTLARARGSRAATTRRPAPAAFEAAVIGLARRPVGTLATELRPAEYMALRSLEVLARADGHSDLAALVNRVRAGWAAETAPRELMML